MLNAARKQKWQHPSSTEDAYTTAQQADALRQALYIILGLNVLSIPPLILSARTYSHDVERAAAGVSATTFA